MPEMFDGAVADHLYHLRMCPQMWRSPQNAEKSADSGKPEGTESTSVDKPADDGIAQRKTIVDLNLNNGDEAQKRVEAFLNMYQELFIDSYRLLEVRSLLTHH